MIACAVGWSAPPPIPCSTRYATKSQTDDAVAHRNDATVNSTTQAA